MELSELLKPSKDITDDEAKKIMPGGMVVQFPKELKDVLIKLSDIYEFGKSVIGTRILVSWIMTVGNENWDGYLNVIKVDKLREMLLSLYPDNSILLLWRYAFESVTYSMISIPTIISETKNYKDDEGVLLNIKSLYILFVMIVQSFFTVEQISDLYRSTRYQTNSILRNNVSDIDMLDLERTNKLYTVGALAEMSIEEKQNIIKSFMNLFIDIK